MPASSEVEARIAELMGARAANRSERVQGLWSGYGEVVRYRLTHADVDTVVAKHVHPPGGRGRSHDRKLRSYEVEQAWFANHALRCGQACRVPRCFHAERMEGAWLFLLEDLDAEGFSVRTQRPSARQLAAALRWLAAFHATFLDERPRGLWKVGTYWHLATRLEEHRGMERGPLRDAARAIDARLSTARFLTWVHGDAKPANFCWSRDGRRVAAVDFQYVGGGCGMKDVAYLLCSEDRAACDQGLDTYFAALRVALAPTGADTDAVEAEWRALFPWAMADFQRFLAGWSPGSQVSMHGQRLVADVLRRLG